MKTSRRIALIALLPILVLLAACQPGAVEPGFAPEIIITPGPTETILLSNEEIMQDNCNGGAMMSQTVERSYTVSRIVELGAAITVDAGGRAGIPGVGEVGVGAAVASHYNVSYGSEERVAREVMVATEKGQHILHTIRQYEIWETGTLTIAGAADPITYRFRKDFSMETLPPANLGCPGGVQPTVGADTPEPPPTAKPPTEGCGPATMQGPLAQGTHTFDGPVHIVQLWRQNGQSPWGDREVMAVVIGQVTILEAGGNVWTYPSDSCRDIAAIHMQDGANSRGSIVVTEQELREAGLIR